ncbi:MAG: HAD-IC family P-type ATPase, partial [Oscillospiraceae bacterium]
MKHYLEELSSVFAKTESSENGLSSTTIEERTLKYGKNKLVEKKKDSFFKRLLAQLSDPMLIILLIAAALSAITAFYAGESLTDVFIILFVVIVNAALGMYQESKAEKAIEALKAMSAATSKVLRDGTLRHIKSEDLVVGDIIMLEAGDAVPADARLVESASLKIDEAALTGESVPVEKFIDKLTLDAEAKDISLGDRKNMVYMGSVVVYGRGRAVVTAIGMETEMGKIADAISNAVDNLTPLQKKLASLSKVLSFIVLGICAFMFVFSLLRADAITSAVIIKTLMLAISLAVAAIPEGLAAVVTVQLSIGVTKMAKHNAVIRKLTAVETLGCTQIICSDKTGTLTQNKMTVVDSYTKDETALSAALALCSDAELDANGEDIGEPTEAALVEHAAKLFTKDMLKELMQRIGEAP